MSLLEVWREKSDDEIRDAAKNLVDYTGQAQQVILAELRRRGLAKPAARGRTPNERTTARPQGAGTFALVFGLVFGFVGFICGFLGPMHLNPSSNLGPITGIILTGPGGILVGVVVGLCVAYQRLSLTASLGALAIGSLLVALASLALSLPGELHDERVGELVDGTVVKCTPVESAEEVLSKWERSIAIKWSKGYVATFSVQRKRDLYIGRKRSNHDSTYAAPWLEKRETARYFVSRELCAMGADGKRTVYLTLAAEDLSIRTLRSVSPSYAAWASQ